MLTRIVAVLLVLCAGTALGASHRTKNFVVTSSSLDVALRVGNQAEVWRQQLSDTWLGEELSTWSEPCSLRVYIRGNTGATGETSFEFEQRRPTHMSMQLLGPLDQLLESILPHEISHLVFATHFGRRLPPWVDEGACTAVESARDQTKLRKALRRIQSGDRFLSLDELLTLDTYPRDIVPLYTQGHALSSYLIANGGEKKFMQFVKDGLEQVDSPNGENCCAGSPRNRWAHSLRQHYGFRSLAHLESSWLAWVNDASFIDDQREGVLLVINSIPDMSAERDMVHDSMGDMVSRM